MSIVDKIKINEYTKEKKIKRKNICLEKEKFLKPGNYV